MTHILIVESSSPPVAASRREKGRSAPQNFEKAFRAFDPTVKLTVREPYIAPLTLQDLEGIDGVVMTGQGDPWPADAVEAQPIREACEIAFAAGIPTIGVCFGLQIAAILLGGKISASPNGIESGLARNVRLTETGKVHAMTAFREDGFAVCCAHRDEVSAMPDGALLLAENDHTQVQAMSYVRDGVDFWGVQYHPELRPGTIAKVFRESDSLFAGNAPSADDLAMAEIDPEAAARLGARISDFARENHTRELSSWLGHIKNQKMSGSLAAAL